ncbi:MAG TPA: serine/threonine-protein kinase, partial [Povalibacter sp.]
MQDPQHFAELNQLLDAALDQPEQLRAQWIEQLPDDAEHLKDRLRELLARTPLDTLPKLNVGAQEGSAVGAYADQPGQCVGPYCLQRIIGDGGMGVVWLARRSDGLLERDVALKIPHGTWQRAGLAERMAGERQILATLCHPNIGRLYDAGLAADGRPYLALEYIEGQPIDAYCRDRALDVRARLALFGQVASAVAYAHGKLVVHRDLKPANILVTAEGQVRLLDFGIARLLEDGRAPHSALTELSGRAMTLDYASPEQIVGEPVTVASDVYSMGVALYELLTDVRPYSLKRDSRGALEDAIVQCEPRRPSDIVGDRSTAKLLRGDLDTIVLKALKKSPQDRYATVNAFAEDIARYFSGRPVLAQPDRIAYRARRFVGRHKLAVSAAMSVLLALVIGTGIAVWQARLAFEQRARAEQVKEFVVSFMRDANPYSRVDGQPLTMADQLQAARIRVERELSDQPQVQIELLAIVAESLKGLAHDQTAAQALERALRRAAEEPGTNPQLTLRLHRMLTEVYSDLGRLDAAREQLRLALASPAMRKGPPTPEWVEVHLQRSALAMEEAHYDEALDAAQTAL